MHAQDRQNSNCSCMLRTGRILTVHSYSGQAKFRSCMPTAGRILFMHAQDRQNSNCLYMLRTGKILTVHACSGQAKCRSCMLTPGIILNVHSCSGQAEFKLFMHIQDTQYSNCSCMLRTGNIITVHACPGQAKLFIHATDRKKSTEWTFLIDLSCARGFLCEIPGPLQRGS